MSTYFGLVLAVLCVGATAQPSLVAPLAYANAPLYAAGGGSSQVDIRHNYDGTLSSYTTAPFGYAGPLAKRYVAAPAAIAKYAAPYAAPYAAAPLAAAAYAAPYAAPHAAPYGAPYATPYAAPYAAPYSAHFAAPYATPYTSAYAAAPFAAGAPVFA